MIPWITFIGQLKNQPYFMCRIVSVQVHVSNSASVLRNFINHYNPPCPPAAGVRVSFQWLKGFRASISQWPSVDWWIIYIQNPKLWTVTAIVLADQYVSMYVALHYDCACVCAGLGAYESSGGESEPEDDIDDVTDQQLQVSVTGLYCFIALLMISQRLSTASLLSPGPQQSPDFLI